MKILDLDMSGDTSSWIYKNLLKIYKKLLKGETFGYVNYISIKLLFKKTQQCKTTMFYIKTCWLGLVPVPPFR